MPAKGCSARSGDGIYLCETRASACSYFRYRKPDGRSATKRGFTSPRAARRERGRTVVSTALGERLSTTGTFGEWFDTWLVNRRPYLEPGTYSDYEIHGHLRRAPLREADEAVAGGCRDAARRVGAGRTQRAQPPSSLTPTRSSAH
jgi:hypothetical protein